MFDMDRVVQQATAAFAPSDAVFARVKDRIREKAKKGTDSGVVLVFVNQNSEKIFEKIFKKQNKLLQKIA